MKKRNESSIVTSILKYMQVLENARQIRWVDRLNSGSISMGKRRIRMCRAGTPDIFAILCSGQMLWIEVKTARGVPSYAQLDWSCMVEDCGHRYLLCRDLDQLINYLQTTRALNDKSDF